MTVVKGIIRSKKEARYTPPALARGKNDSEQSKEYYDNLADVKPGFPLPKDNPEDQSTRKSQFEGSGMSVLSRKRGDRLGFIDRRSGK